MLNIYDHFLALIPSPVLRNVKHQPHGLISGFFNSWYRVLYKLLIVASHCIIKIRKQIVRSFNPP